MEAWLTAALSEYSTLRAESLQSLQAGHNILQFGVTGVAVLIGLGLQDIDKLLALLILLLLVPLVTTFIVVAWFVELLRQVRAGAFIAHLEDKINTALGGASPALEWENWLGRHPEFRLFARIRVSFAILYLLNIAALILAGYLALQANFKLSYPALISAVFGLMSCTIFVINLRLYRRYDGQIRRLMVGLGTEAFQ